MQMQDWSNGAFPGEGKILSQDFYRDRKFTMNGKFLRIIAPKLFGVQNKLTGMEKQSKRLEILLDHIGVLTLAHRLCSI